MPSKLIRDRPYRPAPTPPALKDKAPTTKLLFVWLGPQGEVSYTVRELAELLGVTPPSVEAALTRLRELGLIDDVKLARGSAPGHYRVKR